MIKQALSAYAASSARIFADRSQTVGASEVGQCARKVFYIKNEGDAVYGAARDTEYEDGWGARARGTIYENHWWEPALRATYGENLHFAGADQQTFALGFLSATPDGLIAGLRRDVLAPLGIPNIGSDCILTECKTADPRTNLSSPKAENVFQTQVQIGLVRELTEWKPNYSVLSYTDASFWNEVLEFPIAYDEKVYATAKQRAATIMTATVATDLKPEGWIAGGRECDYCPFNKPCGIERRNVPTQDTIPDPQFVAEIADMARTAKHLEAARDAHEARLREIQQQIKDRLREKSVRKVPGVVTWSAVKGRPSWDNKAIREAAIAAGVDVEQFSSVGEPTDRLQITLKDSAPSGADNTQAAA